ncbi:hypothetical protein [Bradyrhizobium sp. SRS-191]|uniref:hypothetical protein n=1 Tax=Bradyrhizobium sp. SRS-191 TaxID=2962606 RepID=UPI00211DEA27|nr:hypothetical protein [Bradyrhizobium sp. SRS-191]
MISVIRFVEVENRVVSATYRNLMIKAKVVLVDKTSGTQLPDPVTTIASPVPAGSLRIRLSQEVRPGTYFLVAFNGHGSYLAKSAEFEVR